MAKPSPEHEIIVHPIAGQLIRQRTRDAYIDARAFCAAAGKSFDEYTRWNGKFLEALSNQMGMPVRPKPGIPGFALIQSVRGGFPELRGTWVHPRVAVHLGQWLSVEFEVWVTGIVDDWREMQKLLRGEPADWTKRFPDEFFEHIYRLHGWGPFNRSVNPPQVVGGYINDLVWDRLAPGMRQAIELRIPRRPSGGHRERMHQMIAAEIGVDKLKLHIAVLILHMEAAGTWDEFIFIVDRVLSKTRRDLPPPPPQSPDGQLKLDL